MSSLKKQARIAGLLYLLVAILLPIGSVYIPGKLIVRGDATATADNLRASESLFRIGIAAELAGMIVMIFVVLALFWLFKPVNERLAWLMLVLGALVSIPISLSNLVYKPAALVLAGRADFLSPFERGELDSLAYFFLRLHGRGGDIEKFFFGLWLFPFGMLVARSGFIPRFIGILLFVAGFGYLLDAFTALLFPQSVAAVGQITFPLFFAELPVIFWLVVWGAKERPSEPRVS